ncbi:MAG: hypothetical protein KJI69_06375 [Patescibacteria group bacterium]|nr:hypothetical protein [Patescibacteria group bacterium]
MFDSIISNLEPQVVIFGGLTLVSLALVTLVWRISVRYGNHSTEMMQKNSEAWILNAKAQQRNADTMENFGVVMKDSHAGLRKSINKLTKIIEKNGK